MNHEDRHKLIPYKRRRLRGRALAPRLAGLIVAVGLASPTLQAADRPRVQFETSLGSFTIALFPERAPVTVRNFLDYVDGHFYDGMIFHRVIEGFVIQTGGYRTGMEYADPMDPIPNESNNGLQNLRLTVAMARQRRPDSADSQFFINLDDNDTLNPRETRAGYTVFGMVTAGADTVDKIAVVETAVIDGIPDVPTEEVVVLRARRIDIDTLDE